MRKLLIFIVLFTVFATPSYADRDDEFGFYIPLGPVQNFVVNNAGPLTFTYDEYADFGVAQDIGDIDYDLTSNIGWEVAAQIIDSGASQVSNDWDSINWTLTVNGVAIDESGPTVIDSDTNPIDVTGELWEVLLTIPWSEAAGTADCEISLTASTV
jgi:hypothetical protein